MSREGDFVVAWLDAEGHVAARYELRAVARRDATNLARLVANIGGFGGWVLEGVVDAGGVARAPGPRLARLGSGNGQAVDCSGQGRAARQREHG